MTVLKRKNPKPLKLDINKFSVYHWYLNELYKKYKGFNRNKLGGCKKNKVPMCP